MERGEAAPRLAAGFILEISRALTSTLDLERLAHLSLDLLEPVFGYDAALFCTVQNGEAVVQAHRGVGKRQVKTVCGSTPKKVFRRLKPTEPVIDLPAEDLPLAFQRGRGIGCFFEEKLQGALLLLFEGGEGGELLDERSLFTLGNQLAIALKNAYAHAMLRKELEEAALLQQLSCELQLGRDPDKSLLKSLAIAARVLGADLVEIYQYDEPQGRLVPLLPSGAPKPLRLSQKERQWLAKPPVSDGVIAVTVGGSRQAAWRGLARTADCADLPVRRTQTGTAGGADKELLISPMTVRGRTTHVLVCRSRRRGTFHPRLHKVTGLISAIFASFLERQALYDDLQTKAITDGLTSLYNHRYFQERLDEEIRRCDRYEKEVALVLLDIDHFKNVNDRHGHAVGDEVLKDLSVVLRKSFRETDIIARYGGEEFVSVLPETSILGAFTAAERVREAVAGHSFRVGRKAIRCTVSGGVCSYPHYAKSRKDLLEKADRALYAAKQQGRNQVCLAGSDKA